MKTMVVLAGSALDSYAKESGEEAAAKFAYKLYEAMDAFPGHVYLIDEQGPLTRPSLARQALRKSIIDPAFALNHDVEVAAFDQAGVPWGRFTRHLRDKILEDQGPGTPVWLAGLWYDKPNQVGEVLDVYRALSSGGMDVVVDENLTVAPKRKR